MNSSTPWSSPGGQAEPLAQAIEALTVHHHLCLIYDTQAEQFAVVLPFMRIGLERGERCVYIADENTAEEVLNAMRQGGIAVDDHLRSGALSIATKRDSYLKQGRFDPDWMIDFLREHVQAAKAAGFTALRATGEMTWALGPEPGTERLLEYEAKLNYLLPEQDLLGICQYHRARFQPGILKGIIETHPLVIVGGVVGRNPYYIAPDEYLKEGSVSQEVDRLLAGIQTLACYEAELRESQRQLAGANRQLRGESARRGQLEASLAARAAELEKTNRELSASHQAALNMMEDAIEAGLQTEQAYASLQRENAERQRAETALAENERQLRLAMEAGELGMWDWDLRTSRIQWSRGHARMFGLKPEEFDGRFETFQKCIHPEDLPMVEAAIFQARGLRAEFQREFRVCWPDGSEHWILAKGQFLCDAQGEPFRMLGVVQDFTRRRFLEAQLQQAQKMEAIGQLAGGVAHDFNNILAAMMMNLGLLQENPNLGAETQESLKELMSNTERAANLTRQLVMFSRRSVLEVKVLDLNELVANLLKMLGRLIGEHISLRFDRHDRLPPVQADPGMMEQVLMNLAVNARDAMPKGGRLTISTEPVQVDAERVKQNVEVRPGLFVCLSVADTGCGMDDATRKRIFEPFFTTKEPGKGTGLGLATVYGLIAQHKGWVEVESEVGQGATFKVFLPPAAKGATEPAHPEKMAVLGGHETILLVEDEASVRRAVAQRLRLRGYRVLEAEHGQAAMKLWQENAGQIDLLFSDMVMPQGLTGLDLAEKLREEKPNLKVLISSGYNAEMAGQDRPSTGGIVYLQKPYDVEVLSQVVRDCLD